MIPKIIHYAWFGGPMPSSIEKRISEWKEVLPDWKFICWNEKNYNIHKFKFSGEKYDQKKYGYIVDELRYDVLFQYGGFYLDTDEIIKKDLTPLTKNKMIWGFMYDNCVSGGLIGSEAGQSFLKELLLTYNGTINRDIFNDLNDFTSNPIITRVFLKKWPNFRLDGTKQILEDGIIIYPKDYFCYLSRNEDANYAQHLFDNSWGTKNKGLRKITKNLMQNFFPYYFASLSAKRGFEKTQNEYRSSKL